MTADKEKEKLIVPLTEDQKNDLVLRHINIVHYMTNKYYYFDSDVEEVRAWAFLGLAVAINRFESNNDFPLSTYAFPAIKSEMLDHYRKRSRIRYEINLQNEVGIGDEGNTKTVEDFLSDTDSIAISDSDLFQMINEATFEEPPLHKKIIADYLFTDADIDNLAEIYKLPKSAIKRIQGRGKTLIKRYLFNNDIIFDFAVDPITSSEPKKINEQRKLNKEDYGRIKYLRINYPHLGWNEYAEILDTSSYTISSLMLYPTTTYLSAMPDDSIKEKAERYCMDNYPERMPSEVRVIPFEHFEDVI